MISNRRRRFAPVAPALLAAAAAFASVPALSQNPPPVLSGPQSGGAASIGARLQTRVDFVVHEATLELALKQLLSKTGANYTIDPVAREFKVSANLKGVSVQTALDVLLRQSGSGLMFRVENNIVNIVPNPNVPIQAVSRSGIDWQKRVNLDINQGSLVTALRLLFATEGVDYTFDRSAEQAIVTAHFKETAFQTVLDVLLRQAGTPLTYRVENGTVRIVPKPADGLGGAAPFDPNRRVSLDVDAVGLGTALKALFSQVGANYNLEPGLSGSVTLHVNNVPLSTALDLLTRTSPVPLTTRFENGIYTVRKAAPDEQTPEEPATRTITIPGYDLKTSASAVESAITDPFIKV